MKIKKLIVNGYGKFIDKTISLPDGFCVIYGDNESGKSTLQAFIKNMLFSFENKNKDKEGRLPDIKKYKPWSYHQYKGAMELILDDKRHYRVEKDFSQKETKVFNQYLEEVTTSFEYQGREGLQFGEDILKMNRETFSHTAFISQAQTKVYSKEQGEVFDKIINLMETGDEERSVSAALKLLNKAKTLLGHKTTKNRLYNKTVEEVESLKEEKNKVTEVREKMVGKQRRKHELSVEIKELQEAIKEIIQHIDYSNKEDEKNKLEKTLSKYQSYEKEISNRQKIIELYEKKEKENINLKKTSLEEIVHYRKEMGLLPKEKEKEKQQSNQKKQKKNNYFLILSAVGVVLFTLLSNLYIEAIGLGGISFLLFIYFLIVRIKTRKQKNSFEPYEDKKHEIYEYLFQLGYSKDQKTEEMIAFLQEAYEAKKELNEMKVRKEIEEERSRDYINLQKDLCREAGVDSIEEINQKIQNITLELTKKEEQGEEMSRGLDYEKILSETKVLLESKKMELAGVTSLLQAYWTADDQLAELLEKIAEKEELLEKIEEERKALELAEEYIVAAARDIKLDVIPKINKKMSENISQMTAGRHHRLVTGKDNSLHTEYQNEVKNIWDFSDGTIDQMYLCLRMAVTDLFSQHENIPLFIDEAFAFYDHSRIKNTFMLLEKMAEKKQIILFTCKKEEYDIANTLKNTSIILI